MWEVDKGSEHNTVIPAYSKVSRVSLNNQSRWCRVIVRKWLSTEILNGTIYLMCHCRSSYWVRTIELTLRSYQRPYWLRDKCLIVLWKFCYKFITKSAHVPLDMCQCNDKRMLIVKWHFTFSFIYSSKNTIYYLIKQMFSKKVWSLWNNNFVTII